MIPINILRKKGAIIDSEKRFIYIGHFKAGFTSARNYALRDRGVRPSSGKYTNIELTKEEYDKLLRFTIVRNPYDRVLSAFFFLQKGNQGPKIRPGIDFNEWIKNVFKVRGHKFNKHFMPMYDRLIYNGNVWINYIAKLENINDDWKCISKYANLIETFPYKNFHKVKKSRYDYYNDESIEIVTDIYKNDLEKLNYEY